MLCEAAWVVVPTRASSRPSASGSRPAAVPASPRIAVARKLVVLFWQLLTKEQDYAFGRPSPTRKKLRQLELAAGAAPGKGETGVWGANKALRQAELELDPQAKTAYRRLVSDWPPKKGASATAGPASPRPSSGKQRGRAPVPDPAL
jgi:transposase